MSHRIHIFGAAGAGSTSLGISLARKLDLLFFDTDTYFWLDTDPPFTRRRDPGERLELIERDIHEIENWVLAGSISGWGDPLIDRFTLAIFLHLAPEQRMARLLQREKQRYGNRIEPGGEMHTIHTAFMDWAGKYDTEKAPVRSLDLHETWMEQLPCPVLRMDSSRSLDDLVEEIVQQRRGR